MPKSEGLSPLRVAQVIPHREPCGVGDYTRRLSKSLDDLADVEIIDPLEVRSRQGEFDLLHFQHQYFLYGGVAPWKNKFGKLLDGVNRPSILTAHELVEPSGGWLRQSLIERVNRRQFLHTALGGIIVHTQADAETLRRWGVRSNTVRVIHHDVPEITQLPERTSARTRLGLDSQFVCLMLGFVSAKKNHLFAVEVVRRLPDSFHLVIAGGRHPDDLTGYVGEVEQALQEQLSGRYRLTGYLGHSELLDWLAAADCALAPFTATSGSGSLGYCFAAGLPILASDIPPHRELLTGDSKAIRLIRLDSVDWEEALQTLVNDPELAAMYRLGAAKYAEENSTRKMAERTMIEYRRLLE